MNVSGFEFDFPVWLIHIRDGDKEGIECCQFRYQLCLPIFTDEDLIYRFRKERPCPYETIAEAIDSAACLVATLEEYRSTVQYIAFDPSGKKAFICPIRELIGVLEDKGT